MDTKILRDTLLLGAISVGLIAPAQATTLLLNDWTLDLTGLAEGLDGGFLSTEQQHIVTDISQITFLSVFHSVTSDTVTADGLPTVGETFRVTAGGTGTDFFDASNTNVSPTLFGSILTIPGNTQADGSGSAVALDGWEFTFTFDINGQYTNIDGQDANFTHLSAADYSGTDAGTGQLKLYIDNITDGSEATLNSLNQNVTNGTLIATFDVRSGDGGVFDFGVGDGSDDATFELVSALAGVLFDADGNDLSLLTGDPILIGVTDSNFDASPENPDGGGFVFAPQAFECNTLTLSAINFCGEEDGSFRIGTQIPEPATIALLGMGFLGLGGAAVRRKRKAATQ